MKNNVIESELKLIMAVLDVVQNNLEDEPQCCIVLLHIIINILRARSVVDSQDRDLDEFIDKAQKVIDSAVEVSSDAVLFYSIILRSYMKLICCVADDLVLDYHYEQYATNIYDNMVDIIKTTTESN